jgi:hypothetical protein
MSQSGLWVSMPKNFTEYVMLVFLNSYYNTSYDAKANKRQKLYIYDGSGKTQTEFVNILIKATLIDYKEFSDVIVSSTFDYKHVNLQTLYINLLISNKIQLTNIFSKIFVTGQMVTRQFIRKHFNNNDMILIHLSDNSVKNIIYYIIAIQAIFKIERIQEKPLAENENKHIQITNKDLTIVVFSDCKATQKDNIMYCKQIIHQLCLALPILKTPNSIAIGNEYFEDHIKNYRAVPETTSLILYNLSYYTIVSTTEQLLLAMASYFGNGSNFIFPEKIVQKSIVQLLAKQFSLVNYQTVAKKEDITSRFINI